MSWRNQSNNAPLLLILVGPCNSVKWYKIQKTTQCNLSSTNVTQTIVCHWYDIRWRWQTDLRKRVRQREAEAQEDIQRQKAKRESKKN